MTGIEVGQGEVHQMHTLEHIYTAIDKNTARDSTTLFNNLHKPFNNSLEHFGKFRLMLQKKIMTLLSTSFVRSTNPKGKATKDRCIHKARIIVDSCL